MRSVANTVQVLLLLYIVYEEATSGSPWQPKWMVDRNDLICGSNCNPLNKTPIYTLDPSKNYTNCCACSSRTIWRGSEKILLIEFVSLSGESLLLKNHEAFREGDIYKIVHEDSEMTDIPSNICNLNQNKGDFTAYMNSLTNVNDILDKIVRISFKGNKLHRIADINCLTRLDELDLAYNHITHVTNTSFNNLTYLRILNLANNWITQIDEAAIFSPQLRLLHIDLMNNQLESLDITNIISMYPFCNLHFQNNQILEIINTNGFKVDVNKTYGSGYIHLENNCFNTWPDFKELLGIDSLGLVGKVANFGLNFQGAKFICDCNFEPFMSLATDVIDSIWQNHFNLTCAGPEDLVGETIFHVDLDRLICLLEDNDDCPKLCNCTDHPNRNTLDVDCSNRSLSELPSRLPMSKHSEFIKLNVSYNEIRHIANFSYLKDLSVLDISHNKLEELTNNEAELLENATILIISDNLQLTRLPQMLQFQNACKVKTENLIIDCDCESLWIANWLTMKDCDVNQTFKCNVPGRSAYIPATNFSPDQVDCTDANQKLLIILSITLACLLLVLIAIAMIMYKFRYEIMILLLRMKEPNKNTILPQFSYDVFISFDDENDELRGWVESDLISKLERDGYRVFLPYRDLAFGDVKDNVTIDVIKNTRNFLLILSESYLNHVDPFPMEHEWKYGWNMFKSNSLKKLIIINYGHISSFNVGNPQIKAYLRVGHTIDFTNRDNKIMERIHEQLGPPCLNMLPAPRYFDNKNTKLNQLDIFQIVLTTTDEIQECFENRKSNLDNFKADIQYKMKFQSNQLTQKT